MFVHGMGTAVHTSFTGPIKWLLRLYVCVFIVRGIYAAIGTRHGCSEIAKDHGSLNKTIENNKNSKRTEQMKRSVGGFLSLPLQTGSWSRRILAELRLLLVRPAGVSVAALRRRIKISEHFSTALIKAGSGLTWSSPQLRP